MLDLVAIRARFAAYLAANAGTKHSLDAALMHVVQQAYQQGLEDARTIPAALAMPDGLETQENAP